VIHPLRILLKCDQNMSLFYRYFSRCIVYCDTASHMLLQVWRVVRFFDALMCVFCDLQT